MASEVALLEEIYSDNAEVLARLREEFLHFYALKRELKP